MPNVRPDPIAELAEPGQRRHPTLRIARPYREPLDLTLEPDRRGSPWATHLPPGGPVLVSGGKTFHLDAFENELIERLEGKCIGYSYAINQGGQLARSAGGGDRRTAADDGPLDSSPYKRMHIASVTKNLTATAILAALADTPEVSLGSRVKHHLPTLWELGSGVEDIQFRHLLTHTSGIQQDGPATTGYSTLKSTIAAPIADGLTPGEDANYKYDNRNFGLFRIILPYLVCRPLMMSYEVQGTDGGTYDELIDAKTSEFYVSLLRHFTFDRIGVSQADCKPDANDSTRTLFYPFPYDGEEGQDGGDWTNRSGGAGWVLSAYHLAKYMAYRRYSEVLLSESVREMMDNDLLGWRTIAGDHGTYLQHGGDFTVSGPLTAVVMQFPIHVEAALLINSSLTGDSNKAQLVRDAFDAAWS